jgi:replicative DNA helicase
LGLIESKDDKISREYETLIQKINDIELKENNPGKKQMRLIKLAKASGYSLRELENLYRKSLADFSETALKSMSDLLKEYGEDDRQWLLHGFIPEATTILLHAQGGIGKTKLAYELAYNLIEGTNWGHYPVTQKNKVLVYQTDESPQDMKHALVARGYKDNEQLKYRDNWVVDAIPQLIADIEEFQPNFVIIDSLTTVSRYSTFSENDTEYARPLLQIVQIAKQYNCTVMVVHHSNAGDRSRGTRAIFNSVSEVWSFKEDKAENASNLEKLLHIEKSRSRAPMIYRLRFDPDNYSWHCLGREGGDSTDLSNKDKVLKYLCDNRNKAYEAVEIAHYLGIALSTANRILNYLKQEGAISRKDRGQKNQPYCYYVRANATHPPLKSTYTDEQRETSTTTGNTENAAHCIKKVISTDEQRKTSTTTGNTENAAHSPAFFSEKNLEKNSKKSKEGEQHSVNQSQDKDNPLLTPPCYNAAHPEDQSHSLPLKIENAEEYLNRTKQNESQNNCDQIATNGSKTNELPEPIIIEKLGSFGITKACLNVKPSPRKGTKQECVIKLVFPDSSELEVERYVSLAKRELLFDSYIDKKVSEWETKFMVDPANKWEVQQLVGTDEEAKFTWVKDCIMKEAVSPPQKNWYSFITPSGEVLRVTGKDEFRFLGKE